MTDSVIMNDLNDQAGTTPNLPYGDMDKFILQQVQTLGDGSPTAYTLEGTVKDLAKSIKRVTGSWDLTPISTLATIAAGFTFSPFVPAVIGESNTMAATVSSPGFVYFNASMGQFGGSSPQWVACIPDASGANSIALVDFGVGFLTTNAAESLLIFGNPSGAGMEYTYSGYGPGGSGSGMVDASYTPAAAFLISIDPTTRIITVVTSNGSFVVGGGSPILAPAGSTFYGLILAESSDHLTHSMSMQLSNMIGIQAGLSAPGGSLPYHNLNQAAIPEGAYDTQSYTVSAPGDWTTASFGTISLKTNDIVTFSNSATDIFVNRFLTDSYIDSLAVAVVNTAFESPNLNNLKWKGSISGFDLSQATVALNDVYLLTSSFWWSNAADTVGILKRYAPAGSSVVVTATGTYPSFNVLSNGPGFDVPKLGLVQTAGIVLNYLPNSTGWNPETVPATNGNVGGQFEFRLNSNSDITSFGAIPHLTMGVYLAKNGNTGGYNDPSGVIDFNHPTQNDSASGTTSNNYEAVYIDFVADTLNYSASGVNSVVGSALGISGIDRGDIFTFTLTPAVPGFAAYITVYKNNNQLGVVGLEVIGSPISGPGWAPFMNVSVGVSPFSCNTGGVPFTYSLNNVEPVPVPLYKPNTGSVYIASRTLVGTGPAVLYIDMATDEVVQCVTGGSDILIQPYLLPGALLKNREILITIASQSSEVSVVAPGYNAGTGAFPIDQAPGDLAVYTIGINSTITFKLRAVGYQYGVPTNAVLYSVEKLDSTTIAALNTTSTIVLDFISGNTVFPVSAVGMLGTFVIYGTIFYPVDLILIGTGVPAAVTWPSNFKWPGGVPPTLSGGTDRVHVTPDGAGNFLCDFVGAYSAP